MTYSKLKGAEGTLNQLPCNPNNQEKPFRISPTEEDWHIDVPGWGKLVWRKGFWDFCGVIGQKVGVLYCKGSERYWYNEYYARP